MKEDRLKIRFEELIEKYRFWIGGILILAIVCGSAVLIWRENYQKPTLESRIMNYESRIDDLEAEVSKIQETGIQTTNSNDQNSNVQNGAQEQGQVAGASSQKTDSSTSSLFESLRAPQSLERQNDSAKVSGKININTATAAELDASLPGVGPTYAGRIIDYRNANGGFKSIDDIKNVKGIGEKTFEKFKDKISI